MPGSTEPGTSGTGTSRTSHTKKYGIGIDIGGSKVSMVLGTARGRILARREMPTLKGSRVRLCLRNLLSEIHSLIAAARVRKSEILGIGVGIPGVVDAKRGVVPRSPNMQGWKGRPILRILHREFRLPVVMTNDANAAVMGERIFGRCRRAKHIVYLTMSTGIGGGILLDGRLVEGANFVAGEVGHMTIVSGGELCHCGQKGCFEAYASGTSIARFVEKEIRNGRGARIERWMGKKRGITARDVGKAARARHPLAIKAYRRAGYYLGVGIGNLLNILNPEFVVIGGGVLKSAPRDLWQSMLKSCKLHSWPEAYRSVRIVRTSLGDNVGNLGALSLVFSRF